MSPLSGPVLWGAALISAPALWGAFVGTTTTQEALTRYLIVAGLCWMGLAALAMLVGPAPRSHADGLENVDADGQPVRPGEDDLAA